MEACKRFGVSLDDHVSVPLDEALVGSSDAVIVMEAAHRALLVRQYPAYRDRVLLLPLFAPATRRIRGHARYNITDPYGRPVRDFEACYERIEEALDGLIAAMFGGTRWRRA
jgi:protein-tyrosine-phosphatase